MPIFKVRCTLTFPVQAETAGSAVAQAATYFHQEADQGTAPDSVDVWLLSDPKKLPPGWRNAIPWGNDEDETCGEILARSSPGRGEGR